MGSALVFSWMGMDRTKGYLCGLLHDVGRHAILGALAAYVRRDISWRSPPLIEDLLAAHHGKLGAMIIAGWKLPPLFGDVAQYQDNPAAACRFPRVVQAVALANAADRLRGGSPRERALELERLPWATTLEFAPGRLQQLVQAVDSAREDMRLNRLIG